VYSDDVCAVTIKSVGADQQELMKRPDDSKKAGSIIKIVSVGQFRPEKDHPLQLRAMYELRQLVPEETWDKVSTLLKTIDWL
jgi:alpha-1,2-mannosyltransferase